MKTRWRSVCARRSARSRRGLVLHARDALWSLDATQLGRDEQGKVEALHLRDAGTTRSIEPLVGGPARAEDVIALLLLRAARARHATARGRARQRPCWANELVCSYLAHHCVTALWNLPHTPEHNAWVESLHGELKIELDARGDLAEPIAEPTQVPVSIAEAGDSTT